VFWKLPAIKLAPDVIFNIGPLPVTNTLFCTWISIVVLVALFYFGTRRRDLIPRGIQNFMEWAVELLRGLAETVAGSKEMGKKFFPLAATFFLFIVVSNLLDVFPGVDTVGSIDTAVLAQHPGSHPIGPFLFGDISNAVIPWIRPATTDINLNLAMALIAVITAQAFGFYTLGPKEHLLKYINLRSLFKFNFEGLIEFFVGLLEIISEIARIISLSFRLFGNIFAGSVVLAVFAFLLPALADIVFIPFEIFVAVVQALVFSLLTLVYLQTAVTSHDTHGTEAEHAERAEHAGEARQTVTSR
jgi:F-type H+-transporting ATPase subunit a